MISKRKILSVTEQKRRSRLQIFRIWAIQRNEPAKLRTSNMVQLMKDLPEFSGTNEFRIPSDSSIFKLLKMLENEQVTGELERPFSFASLGTQKILRDNGFEDSRRWEIGSTIATLYRMTHQWPSNGLVRHMLDLRQSLNPNDHNSPYHVSIARELSSRDLSMAMAGNPVNYSDRSSAGYDSNINALICFRPWTSKENFDLWIQLSDNIQSDNAFSFLLDLYALDTFSNTFLDSAGFLRAPSTQHDPKNSSIITEIRKLITSWENTT